MLHISKLQQGNRRKSAPPFPKKGVLGITKNSRGITLTDLAAKV